MTKIRHALTVAVAAASAVVLGSTPATAYPTWQSWSPPPSYTCAATSPSTPSTKVINQMCMVRNQTNGTVQGVLLVRNNATVDIRIDRAIQWVEADGYKLESTQIECTWTTVSPGELTVCYAMTIAPEPGDTVHATWLYNGRWTTPAAEDY